MWHWIPDNAVLSAMSAANGHVLHCLMYIFIADADITAVQDCPVCTLKFDASKHTRACHVHDCTRGGCTVVLHDL